MAFVGMTPDQVDSAANGLRGQAQELQAIKTRVQSLVTEASAHWDGNDIVTFRTVWNNTYKPRITSAIERLNSMASELSKQATQQRTTSGDKIGAGKTTTVPSSGAGSAKYVGPTNDSTNPNQAKPYGSAEGPKLFDYDKAGERVDLGMTGLGKSGSGHYTKVGIGTLLPGMGATIAATTGGKIPEGSGGEYVPIISTHTEKTTVKVDSNDPDSEEVTVTQWVDTDPDKVPAEVDPKDIPPRGTGLPDIGTTIKVAQFGQVEGTYGSEGSAEGSVTLAPGLSAEGSASYWAGLHGEASGGVTVNDGRLSVGGSAMAGVGVHAAAQGAATWGAVQAQGSVEATAGAWVSGDASVSVGAGGLKANIGADAMVGASASASASIGVAGIQGGVTGTAYAGLGVKANVDVKFTTEEIKVSFDLGAALGVGVGVKFDITITPADAINKIKELWPF